ncbi:MAG TPA: MoaD/ThiS family protein [Bacillota bacterium]|nr:MAG: hypothetical protein BWY00_01105 [Firmicutes bacterium ADurb.Bin153]HNV35018.1 MoaD/ThiS family protein [Bacillota bacterium]HPU96105.1 MoaD/ThiS family protein [Bacillota bacterium]
MVDVKGKATLEKYSRRIEGRPGLLVEGVFDAIALPPGLRPVVLAIRNGKVVQHDETVLDGDTIELLIIPEGG